MQSILGIEHPDFVAYFLKIINLLYTKNLYKLIKGEKMYGL